MNSDPARAGALSLPVERRRDGDADAAELVAAGRESRGEAAPRGARAVLSGRGIYKEFPSGEARLEVLRGLDFELLPGETVSIVGESGAGKSTLLQILGGLDRPTRGEVWLEDARLDRLADRELSRVRNRAVGFVFQFHHLLMDFTALENVMMPLLIRGLDRDEAGMAAEQLLRRVGLGRRLSHKPRALSGGEQQRVAVARALVHDPRVILADEPTGNLDHRNSSRLHELLFELAEERGVAFAVVTHNQELARETDRSLTLEDGVLRAS